MDNKNITLNDMIGVKIYKPTGNVDTSNPPQGGSGVVEFSSVVTETVVADNSGSSLNKPLVEQTGE